MSGRYLLDTTIIIALFANDASVKEKLAQAGEGQAVETQHVSQSACRADVLAVRRLK